MWESQETLMCITNSHDMTLAVKGALNPNTININILIQISRSLVEWAQGLEELTFFRK